MYCSNQKRRHAENILNIFTEIITKLLVCSKTFLDIYLVAPECQTHQKLFRSQESKFQYSKLQCTKTSIWQIFKNINYSKMVLGSGSHDVK